jgi:SAM-dependent methyltransferase
MEREDETAAFWFANMSKEQLAEIAANMHRDRRIVAEGEGYREVMAVRKAIAAALIRGEGLEVGAGNRPWPLPENVRCFYGDTLRVDQLKIYFRETGDLDQLRSDGEINAQTYAGIADSSVDFVISAHVIEHLPDPIGSLREAMRILKPGGVHLLAVPDMRYTFDRNRPLTTLEHLLADENDSGQGTRQQAYEETVRYVHPIWNPPIPEDQIQANVDAVSASNMDIHWHAWTFESFQAMLDAIAPRLRFSVVFQAPVQNEAIFALSKSTVQIDAPSPLKAALARLGKALGVVSAESRFEDAESDAVALPV